MSGAGEVVLLTNLPYDGLTAETVFSGLGAAYHRAGYSVLAVGQYPVAGGVPAREKRKWGRIARVGGRSMRHAERARMTQRDLRGLLAGAEFVHLHYVSSWAPLAAFSRELARSELPFGFTFQDHGNPEFYHPVTARRLLRGLAGRALWTTALSRFIAGKVVADMPELGGAIRVVPNGHDGPPRGPAAGSASRPFVLCPAKQNYYKGIDILLMAWAKVCERLPGVELAVCGPDYHEGRHVRLARLLGISPRVRFLGERPAAAVGRLMEKSLFVVLPSRHEAFGLVLLEAMARRKAVVATRSGGPAEIVEDGVSGLLAPPKDVAELSKRLLLLLRRPALRRRLEGGAARRARDYRWETVAGRYLSLGGFPRAEAAQR